LLRLLLVPLLYFVRFPYLDNFGTGIVIGALLMSIYNDLAKYGLKRTLMLPVTREVRMLEDLIQHGDLDAIRKMVAQMPPKHFVSMSMS
jgi:hypothetical protein